MLEVDLFRRPVAAQAFTEDVEEHAKREFSILAPLDDIRGQDLILQLHQAVAPGAQLQQRGLLMDRERG